jgi:hypothetical protein
MHTTKGIEILENVHYIHQIIYILIYFHFSQCLLDFTNLFP